VACKKQTFQADHGPPVVQRKHRDGRYRVKRHESDSIFEVLAQKGLYVEYYVYPDEGHGFARPSNNLDFNLRVDNFLAKCLHGRSEPLIPIPGATTQIISGPLGPIGTAVAPSLAPFGLDPLSAPGPLAGTGPLPSSGSPMEAAEPKTASALEPTSIGR
jgi:Prolyl oligopeptidase family